MAKEENEIPLKLNSNIKQIYATGAFGGFTPYDCRIVLFNDSTIPTTESDESFQVARIADYEIIMSHVSIKELYMWLGERLKEFEDLTGPIERLKVKDPEKIKELIKSEEVVQKKSKKSKK